MLTQRFVDAFKYAFDLHAAQTRKGTQIPYISHLMAVAALVLEHGGDEDQAIAALLHDAVEDQGGHRILAEIQSRFGQRVADIVVGCTDAYTIPKPPWRERKEAYLRHLPLASADILLVSLADKLHNARSILIDSKYGEKEVWERFKGGKEGTLWYYQSLVEIFSKVLPGPMSDELAVTVAEVEQRSGQV